MEPNKFQTNPEEITYSNIWHQVEQAKQELNAISNAMQRVNSQTKNDKFLINPEEITWHSPDPTWEYSEAWHQLQQARQELNAILNTMQRVDIRTPEVDKLMRTCIHSIQSRLEHTADILSF